MRLCRFLIPFLSALAIAHTAFGQSYPPAWSSAASYAIGDQVQLNGNVLRAVRAVSPGGFKYAYWELWDVRANTTILIGAGGQFTTLAAAWNYALNCRIAQGSYLHLYILANHHEILPAPISLDHPFGASMSLIGADAANDIFSFNAVNGLDIDTGHVFGLVSNLTVQGSNAQGTPTITSGTVGISVNSNALLSTESLALSYFDTGMEALFGGSLFSGVGNNADTISTFTSAGVFTVDHGIVTIETPIDLDGEIGGTPTAQNGFHCSQESEIKAYGCSAKNCVRSEFQADTASYMLAEACSADGAGIAQGFVTDTNGRLDAGGATVAHATYGYVSQDGGAIYAQNSHVTSTSSVYDYYAIYGSLILAQGAQAGASYETDLASGVDFAGNRGSLIVQ